MELLESLSLKVELFPACAIDDAARDLCTLSERIGCLCEAEFNGVTLWARPGDNPRQIARHYMELVDSDCRIKIAQHRRL
jgi:hypothetical protein